MTSGHTDIELTCIDVLQELEATNRSIRELDDLVSEERMQASKLAGRRNREQTIMLGSSNESEEIKCEISEQNASEMMLRDKIDAFEKLFNAGRDDEGSTIFNDTPPKKLVLSPFTYPEDNRLNERNKKTEAEEREIMDEEFRSTIKDDERYQEETTFCNRSEEGCFDQPEATFPTWDLRADVAETNNDPWDKLRDTNSREFGGEDDDGDSSKRTEASDIEELLDNLEKEFRQDVIAFEEEFEYSFSDKISVFIDSAPTDGEDRLLSTEESSPLKTNGGLCSVASPLTRIPEVDKSEDMTLVGALNIFGSWVAGTARNISEVFQDEDSDSEGSFCPRETDGTGGSASKDPSNGDWMEIQHTVEGMLLDFIDPEQTSCIFQSNLIEVSREISAEKKNEICPRGEGRESFLTTLASSFKDGIDVTSSAIEPYAVKFTAHAMRPFYKKKKIKS